MRNWRKWFEITQKRRALEAAEWEKSRDAQPGAQNETRLKILAAARSGELELVHLDAALRAPAQLGFAQSEIEELYVLRSQLIAVKNARDLSQTVACHVCGGDGGADNRCSHCGGNGIEPVAA